LPVVILYKDFYGLLHEEKHYPYSTYLKLNVLYLNRTVLATRYDKTNRFDYWAKLFKSNTWEELQGLAKLDLLGEKAAMTGDILMQ